MEWFKILSALFLVMMLVVLFPRVKDLLDEAGALLELPVLRA